jgi:LacI family transcriptional regulator, galactose operon repressor
LATRRAPTIFDVAREAGVGIATVSRVLNDSPLVNARTRVRVQEAIELLGYRPNAAARALSLGRSHAVGVVAPFFTTHSVLQRLRGIFDRLHAEGYDLVLFDVETPEQRTQALHDRARLGRLAGLIVVSLPLDDEEVEVLGREDLPVVLVDVGHPRLPHVLIDDVHGGELAADHLLARGHRRIGFIGDEPANPFGFASSERRRVGLHAALERAGVDPAPELERVGRHGIEPARRLAEDLLGVPDPPTAVFAASDIQAIGVLQAASALGARVPEDVAVVGFDDIEMAAVMGLTTVHQPLEATGARGADLVLAAIEGREPETLAELAPLRVVERRTT